MNFFWGSSSKSKSKDKLSETRSNPNSSKSGHINKLNNEPSGPFIHQFPYSIERQFGESFTFRSANLLELYETDCLGLGPPDLLHVTATDTFRDDLEIGQFLHINGIILTDEKMAIQVMSLFNDSISDPDVVKDKKNNGNNSKLQKDTNIATYCAFNLFAKVDIRIRYDYSHDKHQISLFDCVSNNIISLDTFANSIELSQLDKNDNNDINPEELIRRLWEETYVSACIRTLLTNTDNIRKFPTMVQLPFTINANPFPQTSYEKIIVILCHYIPRCLETGWDTTRNVYPTIIHNHLTNAILTLLSFVPSLIPLSLETLKELSIKDPNNELYYRIVSIAILYQDNSNDILMIQEINKTLEPLLPMLDKTNSKDLNSSLQLINCTTDLLFLQISFLISNNDYESAFPLAKFSTQLASDSFSSWFFLTKCYIHFKQFENALLSINSMPHLLNIDRVKLALAYDSLNFDYYKRPLCTKKTTSMDLTSYELNHIESTTSLKLVKEKNLPKYIFGRTILPDQIDKKGYMEKVWNIDALEIGPVYGSQSTNLINFVSPNEVKSVMDYNLLARNTVAKQVGWFHKLVCSILVELKDEIGWNELLELRSKVFVMEKEYAAGTTESTLNVQEANGNSTISLTNKFRTKRLCERWLDDLFLDLYEDLCISTSIQEDKATAKYSGLEWELLGLTLLRTCNYSDAIACLRTSMLARLDPISCEQLLKIYLVEPINENMLYYGLNNMKIDSDVIINLVLQNISYQYRFYDSLQIINRRVLFKLANELGLDALRSRIIATPSVTDGLIVLIEELLSWVQIMVDS
ncbi:hypothetical protein TBLA_0C02970 [Henningerozyma blattae CBS 6284]|uniref:Uncharacterized protein n=1 Tax=Henningerozyma blattae (strain ATCC 34711 / CBS 6284 / DSM 70876 / NBRC 10599 / NRRL Y-10934 / UCD 77-7) TaxID=1071380 RepID=I2H149_HENB6|nr:hypothetical protein TBLA_0C02970 [Tetrapisispora blattae CBS 6284]CCH60101.1 hypothetical protein TBLA_0C02970 [Tetrapisispora blattae CBS 6284]